MQRSQSRHGKTAGASPTPDGYIAAIAVAHGFNVATRDVAPFHAAGVTVINPWALPSTSR